MLLIRLEMPTWASSAALSAPGLFLKLKCGCYFANLLEMIAAE
jgi:hypothetical protein